MVREFLEGLETTVEDANLIIMLTVREFLEGLETTPDDAELLAKI